MGGFLLLGLSVVLSGKRLLPGATLQVGQEMLPLAPSPAAFSDAVKLHGQLLRRLERARAVYVFGGDHEAIPAHASRRQGRPLALNALPVLEIGAETPLLMDAYGFHAAHAAVLGAYDTNRSSEDFTVLVLGEWEGTLRATALVQVTQRVISAEVETEREPLIRRQVTTYDASGEVLQYAFLERENRREAARVGARHFWHRYDEAKVAEEGPALVSFPDPWIYGGRRSQEGVEAPLHSRFIYVLAVSP